MRWPAIHAPSKRSRLTSSVVSVAPRRTGRAVRSPSTSGNLVPESATGPHCLRLRWVPARQADRRGRSRQRTRDVRDEQDVGDRLRDVDHRRRAAAGSRAVMNACRLRRAARAAGRHSRQAAGSGAAARIAAAPAGRRGLAARRRVVVQKGMDRVVVLYWRIELLQRRSDRGGVRPARRRVRRRAGGLRACSGDRETQISRRSCAVSTSSSRPSTPSFS